MLTRLVFAATALVLALIAAALTAPLRAPLLQLAATGLGERSYAVRLKELPVGQLQQTAVRTLTGDYSYTSALSFQLAQGQPVRVTEEKLFAGRPPYELLHARQQDITAASESDIQLRRTANGTYEAQIRRGTSSQIQSLNWQHPLNDYLAVEAWLPSAQPGIEASFKSLDFGRLNLRRDLWTLREVTDSGYEVTKSSPVEATRLQLDKNFRPIRFSMAGTFTIEAIDPAQLPISPEPVFHSSTYQIRVDKPLDNYQDIEGLTLRVLGNTRLTDDWESATQTDQATLLRSRANPQRPEQAEDRVRYLREELSYPVNLDNVRDLASSAVNPLATTAEQARQLVGFVHNYIQYDHHSTMQSVLDVIRNQRGDCNEYAELYTTLSRALGIPARTVIGLAYTQERQPAFALHAWNEALIDGTWHSFDPTWNETIVDATHLPLPAEGGSLLRNITSLNELSFEVVSVRYFNAADDS